MNQPALIDPVSLTAILALETQIRDLAETILSKSRDWDEEEIQYLRDHLTAADFAGELAEVHDYDLPCDIILHSRASQLKAFHLHALDGWLNIMLTPATDDDE